MVDRIGQQLGNYRLVRLLGRGGFAEVYLGEHLRLGTQAAVKVLYTRLATPNEVESFEKEARTIAHLKHPHIVRVFDFDMEDDTPFLVMDYATGGTLRQRHPKGTHLPLTTILPYVKQVADALQYAHDRRLIHRDVKPENMLVGEHDEVLLSDFGIAILAQSSRYQSTQEMAGTMAYMAPEQIQGKPRPASDQYSLGIVVYEWLSGDRPFHGSLREIVGQHLAVPPPSLLENVPTISPDVEQVVMTALAKDAKERFGSVQALANALELAGQADVATFVKPPVPVVQPPRTTIPADLPRTLPVSPPAPPKQPAANIKPVGTVIYTYRGHSSAVRAVAWSPDGGRIASGSRDKTVQVWDAANGDNAFTYNGHSGYVDAIAWSPSGAHIASGSADKTVQVWNMPPASKKIIFSGHTSSITDITWSPDEQALASCSGEDAVQVWDRSRARYIIIYRGHDAPVYAVAWSPDGKRIVSASRDQVVQIWSATAGRKLLTYDGHCGRQWAWVNTLAWSPDGEYMASGDMNGIIQVWMAASGNTIATCRGHAAPVYRVAWSPDGKFIASASGDGMVQVWEAKTGKNVLAHRHAGPVYAVAWSPDGKYIASGGDNKTVQVWQAE